MIPVSRYLWQICGLGLATLTGLTALGESIGLIELPDALVVGAALRAPIFLHAHMAAAGLAIILVPIAMLLAQNPHRHRPVARLAALAVVIAGISALPVALASGSSVLARAGFLAQGVTWLTLVWVGLAAIKRRRMEQHFQAMALMAAVTSAAINLRLLLAAQAQLFPFADTETIYGLLVWISWTVPLLATGLVLSVRIRTFDAAPQSDTKASAALGG